MAYSGRFSAADQAQLHNGDVFNTTTNYYHARPLSSEEIARLNMAFLKAAKEGQTDRLKVLERRGADPDCADDIDCGALHKACWGGFDGTVNALLAMGVDANAYSQYYGTPLCIASFLGYTDLAETLLKAGAKADAPGGWFGSALHAACYSGNLQTVTLLLDRVPSPQSRRTVCRNIFYSYPDPHKDVELEFRESGPTYTACLRGHTSIVESLLDRGGDVNAFARTWSHIVDPERKDSSKATPKDGRMTCLQIAAVSNQFDTVKLLLRRKADPDLADYEGRTAIMMAAYHGFEGCAGALLQSGATIDVCDRNGWSAAIYAAHFGHIMLLQLLIKNGASVEIRDNSGRTALEHAKLGGHTKCVALLERSKQQRRPP